MELTSKEAYEVLGGRSEVDEFLEEVNGKFGKWASVTIEPNIPEEDFEPEEFGQESDYLKVEIVLKNGDYSMYDKVGEFVWGWFDEHGLDFSHDDTYAAGKDLVEAFVVKTPSDLQQEAKTMKKLNITKEQFNRSRYFKNKYGTLEYVSESGKYFKTNKGKVLMFKESIRDIDAEGKIQDWGTTVYVEPLGAELDWKDVYDFVKADCRLYPLLEEDIGVKPYQEPTDKQIRRWIKTKPESFINYLKEFGYYDYMNGADRDGLEFESSRKFGRKFVKESTGGFVEVSAIVKGIGKTIEEAMENFDQEMEAVSSEEWDSWSQNMEPRKDRQYWIDEYNKWNEENEGDVDFTVIDDRG